MKTLLIGSESGSVFGMKLVHIHRLTSLAQVYPVYVLTLVRQRRTVKTKDMERKGKDRHLGEAGVS